MNYIKCLPVALLFVVASSFSFSQKFEGIIKIQNSIDKMMNQTSFTINGNWAMTESKNSDGKVKMVLNKKTGKKLTITEMDGNKIAIIKNGNDMQFQSTNTNYYMARSIDKSVNVQVFRETKMINGYKCYKVKASDSQYEGVAWITKQLDVRPDNIFPVLKIQQRAMPKVAMALKNSMDGFVIEMTLKDIETKKIQRLTTQIERKEIDNKVFDVSIQGMEVYDAEKIRALLKDAKGNPEKMRRARELLSQMRMQ